VKSAVVPEPDRQAAVATALRLADMLANLAIAYDGGRQSGILLKHAAAQLLPGLQVWHCSDAFWHANRGSLAGTRCVCTLTCRICSLPVQQDGE
jgi:hypothetical protein